MKAVYKIFEYQGGKRRRRRQARYPGVNSYAYDKATKNTYSEGGKD